MQVRVSSSGRSLNCLIRSSLWKPLSGASISTLCPRPMLRTRAKVVEELWRRVGKGVAAERSDRDARNAVRAAPDRCQRDQENVAAGQVGVLVGLVGGGNARAGHAPVVAVQDRGRGGEHRRRHHVAIVERVEEGLQALELHLFPCETASHVDRDTLRRRLPISRSAPSCPGHRSPILKFFPRRLSLFSARP